MKNYDIVILGENIEGITASIYCSRVGLKTLLVGLNGPTGDDLSNLKLAHRLKQQAKDYNVDFLQTSIHFISPKITPKIVYTEAGPISSKAIILAMGVSAKKLGIPLESVFHGCGINYHNSCVSSYLKGRTVAIFGNNDSCADHAITLSALVRQVYLIYPNGKIFASPEKIEVIKNAPNIVALPKTLIYNITQNNKKLTGISIIDKTTGNIGSLDCEIIYVLKGVEPKSKLCTPYILVDKNGFIMTDESCKTNIDGIYAVGPIRSTMVDDGRYHYQAYNANMAATDGAIAAINAIKYINS